MAIAAESPPGPVRSGGIQARGARLTRSAALGRLVRRVTRPGNHPHHPHRAAEPGPGMRPHGRPPRPHDAHRRLTRQGEVRRSGPGGRPCHPSRPRSVRSDFGDDPARSRRTVSGQLHCHSPGRNTRVGLGGVADRPALDRRRRHRVEPHRHRLRHPRLNTQGTCHRTGAH